MPLDATHGMFYKQGPEKKLHLIYGIDIWLHCHNYWDVIIYPILTDDGGMITSRQYVNQLQQLKLWMFGWVITSHIKRWM